MSYFSTEPLDADTLVCFELELDLMLEDLLFGATDDD